MLTSVCWGGLAYLSAPKLEMAGDLTKITQSPVSKTTGNPTVASAVGATIVGKDQVDTRHDYRSTSMSSRGSLIGFFTVSRRDRFKRNVRDTNCA